MVEVKNNLGMLPAKFLGIGNGTLCHITQKSGVGIVAGTLGNLEDYRRLLLGSGLDDGLKLLHVVEVESRDCVSPFDSLCKHLTGVHKTQFFIAYHFNITKLVGLILICRTSPSVSTNPLLIRPQNYKIFASHPPLFNNFSIWNEVRSEEGGENRRQEQGVGTETKSYKIFHALIITHSLLLPSIFSPLLTSYFSLQYPNISSVVSTTTLPSFERESMSRSSTLPRMP